jgi:hypothetical protein
MCVEDVKTDAALGVRFMTVIEDEEEGRSVKTESSVRAIPIHSVLIRIGFLAFVEHVRKSSDQSARLFPQLTPGPKRGFGEAFSKWFGRYKRKFGITNPNSVFHSFLHGFKDALRAASVNEDINDAITGAQRRQWGCPWIWLEGYGPPVRVSDPLRGRGQGPLSRPRPLQLLGGPRPKAPQIEPRAREDRVHDPNPVPQKLRKFLSASAAKGSRGVPW